MQLTKYDYDQKKILIMGLPGSGKTTLAKQLVKKLVSVLWLNADVIRKQHNDWDFSLRGRSRQATRLSKLANNADREYIVCDFVAPLPIYREIFAPDYLIWMDTIKEGRFNDTNQLFVMPDEEYDYRIQDFNDIDINLIIKDILNN